MYIMQLYIIYLHYSGVRAYLYIGMENMALIGGLCLSAVYIERFLRQDHGKASVFDVRPNACRSRAIGRSHP